MRKERLTEHLWEQAKNLYLSGVTFEEVGKRFDVSIRCVHHGLLKRGITPRKRGAAVGSTFGTKKLPLDKRLEMLEEIKSRHSRGENLRSIGKRFGVSHQYCSLLLIADTNKSFGIHTQK